MKRKLVEQESNGIRYLVVKRRFLFWWINEITPSGIEWLMSEIDRRKKDESLDECEGT